MKKVLIFIFFFFITFLNVYGKEEYLKNILVDGVGINEFSSDKTVYDINLEGDKEKIKLTYEYDINIYQGKGNYGEIELKYGLNELSYTLTKKDNPEESITYKINITREDLRSNDNNLSSLTISNIKVDLTDKLEYDVYVDSKLKSASLKAVLSSNSASFISGYGERTGNNEVKLNGESTKVEVKVKAENESIKTYVINIIKKDYKSNDATLKTLTIDNQNLNFKSTVYEYNLSVLYEVDKINIKAIPNDNKASIEGLGEINLKEGVNNLVVSVTAEDETKKEYKINITREKEIPLVNNIEITGIEFEFDPLKYNYQIETDLDSLEFNITLNKETTTYEILNNESLKNESVVKINLVDSEKTVTYSFLIKKAEEIKEDEKEEVEEDKKDKINKFLNKYEMYIGLGVFGLGLLSLLIAILTRPKNSQIM